MEVCFWDAIISSQMSFCLAPKIFNAVDMIVCICEDMRVIDPVMMEFRDVEHVIGSKAVGVDDAVWENHPLHNRQQGR